MQNYNLKFKNLRKKYPRFIYEDYSCKISGDNLEIFFDFVLRSFKQRRISSDVKFQPKILIKNVDKKRLAKIGNRVLNNLVFNLGIIEMISYWKATCSPEIIIKTGYLNKEQINWWKDLIIKGMGQFFYENKIDFTRPNFFKISSSRAKRRVEKNEGSLSSRRKPKMIEHCNDKLKNRALVPVGGGKDAIVTLEKLKQRKKEINAFMVNPTKAAKDVLKVSGIKNKILVERKIDPTLLELNKKGYLNGHTPVTALLSFLSVICAVLFDYKNIIFSNEKSADEGNIKYLGEMINHQYSKSSEFERKFRRYCQKYLAKNINYFSFLRNFTELEISKMFSKYPKYFLAFSSCNLATKIVWESRKGREKKWCGNCPKCLFVYAAFYPFLEKKVLLKIFGKDIFENKKLLPTMKGLLGWGRPKPFECVGTKKENLVAFYLSYQKVREQFSDRLPLLLEYFEREILPQYKSLEKESKNNNEFVEQST